MVNDEKVASKTQTQFKAIVQNPYLETKMAKIDTLDFSAKPQWYTEFYPKDGLHSLENYSTLRIQYWFKRVGQYLDHIVFPRIHFYMCM